MRDYPKSAKDAKAAGERYYYTDEVCVHGHDSLRLACNHACRACVLLRDRVRRNREKERLKKWREEQHRGLKTITLLVPENAVDVAIEWANSCLVAAGRHPSNVKETK